MKHRNLHRKSQQFVSMLIVIALIIAFFWFGIYTSNKVGNWKLEAKSRLEVDKLKAEITGGDVGMERVTGFASHDLTKEQIKELIKKTAKRHNLPSEIALSVARRESDFRQYGENGKVLKSPKGARGIFQILPSTAEDLNINPDDPVQNIEGGVTYIKWLLERNKGDLTLALASYNAGIGNVEKYDGVPPFPETKEFIKDTLKYFKEYQAQQIDFDFEIDPGDIQKPKLFVIETENGIIQFADTDKSGDFDHKADKLWVVYDKDGQVFLTSDDYKRYLEGNGDIPTDDLYRIVDSSCFLPTTQITLADSSKKQIQYIKKGDKVLSYDLENNKPVASVVLNTFSKIDNEYLIINDKIKVTPYHVVYAKRKYNNNDFDTIKNTNNNLNFKD